MSQICATSRFPVPNVLSPFLGDHGALIIHAGGRWYTWIGNEWHPNKAGMTGAEFYRAFKCRPPSNVDDGWGGIAPLTTHQQNWTKKDIKAAFDQFMREHAHEYARPEGNCFDPLKKGRVLKRAQVRSMRERVEHDGLIFPAPVPSGVKV